MATSLASLATVARSAGLATAKPISRPTAHSTAISAKASLKT
jgi:hypothetical protein